MINPRARYWVLFMSDSENFKGEFSLKLELTGEELQALVDMAKERVKKGKRRR